MDQDKEDGAFLKATIYIQKTYRGHLSRKLFHNKKIRETRAELLKREIIDKLKANKKKSDKEKMISERLTKEEQEFNLQKIKVEELTIIRDRDKTVLNDF